MSLTTLPTYHKLKEHYQAINGQHLRQWFDQDLARARDFSLQVGDYYIDYSKNRITQETMALLLDLAKEAGLVERRRALFAGEKINTTENRAVLHMALRASAGEQYFVDGQNVLPKVLEVKNRLYQLADQVRSGAWKGATGKTIKTVVNIGIGGSDLSPLMAYQGLKWYSNRDISIRFMSNVDGTHFHEIIRDIDPETTLFIVASKKFTTDETMTNAFSARKWVTDKLGDASVSHHFVALSTNLELVKKFGIALENCFEFWDWVGGRYSLTSAIGLPVMIAIGPERFEEMQAGFAHMDQHFLTAPLEKNAPVILALLGIWYINFFNTATHAVIPYEMYLHRMAAHLQQVDMESNGKSARLDGSWVDHATSPIVWGGTGTNYEHSAMQLIHQGTQIVPIDFIAYANPLISVGDHHHRLIAHMLAQAEALAFGKKSDVVRKEGVPEELVPHKTFAGNRPSTVILGDKLTPRAFGQLIALYEHKVFVQGVLWGVNSFDQYGVELGKELATNITNEFMDNTKCQIHDASTNTLIQKFLGLRMGK